MIITITIDTTHAAFERPDEEIPRILRHLAYQYRDGEIEPDIDAEWPILDFNGNRCGTVKHTKETPT